MLIVQLDLQIFLLLYLLHDGKHLGGLQVGGGINTSNALSYIDEGASHVIVTSVRIIFVYFFQVDFCFSPHFMLPYALAKTFFSYCCNQYKLTIFDGMQALIKPSLHLSCTCALESQKSFHCDE